MYIRDLFSSQQLHRFRKNARVRHDVHGKGTVVKIGTPCTSYLSLFYLTLSYLISILPYIILYDLIILSSYHLSYLIGRARRVLCEVRRCRLRRRSHGAPDHVRPYVGHAVREGRGLDAAAAAAGAARGRAGMPSCSRQSSVVSSQ